MTTRKFIYYHDSPSSKGGKVMVSVHLLVGYNTATLRDCLRMVRELRKTFPKASADRIRLCKVVASSEYRGFTMVEWSGRIKPDDTYPEWTVRSMRNMDYTWV